MKAKRKSLLSIGLVLLCLGAFPQASRKEKSANPQTKMLKNGTTRLVSLLKLARTQMTRSVTSRTARDSAQKNIKIAVMLNSRLKSDRYRGLIAWTQLIYYDNQHDYTNSLSFARTAIPFLLKSHAYAPLGNTYLIYSKYLSYDNYKLKIEALKKAEYYDRLAGNQTEIITAKLSGAKYAKAYKEFSITRLKGTQLQSGLVPKKEDKVQAMLLLQVAEYFIEKPLEEPSDIDSARFLMQEAARINSKLKDPDCKAAVAICQADIYRENYDGSSEIAELRKGIKSLANTKSNYNALGDLYFRLSQFYPNEDRSLSSKLTTAQTALDFYKSSGQKRKMGNVLYYLGQIYTDNQQIDQAHNAFEQTLKLYKSVNDTELAEIYYALSFNAKQKADYRLGINLEFEFQKHISPFTPYHFRVDCVKDLMLSYNSIGKMAETIEQAKKYSEIAASAEDFDTFYVALRYLTDFLTQDHQAIRALAEINKAVKLHPPGDILQEREADESFGMPLTSLHQYKAAEHYMSDYARSLSYPCFDSYSTVGSIDYYANYGECLFFIARFYNSIGNLAKARSYRKQINGITAEGLRRYPNVLYVWERLASKTDTLFQDYRSAVIHYGLYQKAKNQILSASKNQSLKELNTTYRTEARAKDLKLLASKNEIQKSQLSRIKFEKNVVIAGIAIAFFVGLLIYYNFRAKQRSNHDLEAKQAKINKQNDELGYLLSEKEKLLEDRDKLLKEKEMLMKEVQYRIEDNLQLIGSLLDSQSAFLDDDALQAIQKSQHRIQAIALAHQKLYENTYATEVAVDVYLRELVNYLQDSVLPDRTIVFNMDVVEMTIPGNQAVPLGLIVNETITNSIKHAFTNGHRGRIDISLKPESDDYFLLRISDNGVGLSHDYEKKAKSGSMGINLIKGLARTIHGEVFTESGDGTTIILRFMRTA